MALAHMLLEAGWVSWQCPHWVVLGPWLQNPVAFNGSESSERHSQSQRPGPQLAHSPRPCPPDPTQSSQATLCRVGSAVYGDHPPALTAQSRLTSQSAWLRWGGHLSMSWLPPNGHYDVGNDQPDQALRRGDNNDKSSPNQCSIAAQCASDHYFNSCNCDLARFHRKWACDPVLLKHRPAVAM